MDDNITRGDSYKYKCINGVFYENGQEVDKYIEYMGTMHEDCLKDAVKFVNEPNKHYDIMDVIPEQYVNKVIELHLLLKSDGQFTLCWPRDDIAWNAFHLVCADWLWHNDNRAIGIFYLERLGEYFPKIPREYNKSVMYFAPACEGKGQRMDVIFLLDGCHEFIGDAGAMARTVILINTEDAKDEH